ncbi:MAG TPA: bifunctional methylenetetrahydrofolate dehydrogenase/methenyltetrahydrofolate cyclohydrolase FolD [Candidatus Limnocylindrales bacterium]|nr:bifunctional methylenetetrahydrofolate dehydrogenase/methenyltetrahydrofolate cyclohydrolase FolD [Candidatus Limnocylindrales bacterium]
MPARLIDGAAHARAIRAELARAMANLPPSARRPSITVVQVGDDPASSVYVRNKHRAAEEVGFRSAIEHLPAAITQPELHARLDALAHDPQVDAILLQMPLPAHLNPDLALDRLPPAKDVDGLHPYNAGRLAQGNPTFIPATPLGVLELLRRERIDPTGAHAVIVGRSRLVGRPLALLLLQNHATVTIAHSKTRDLPALARTADILVAATGAPGLIRGEHVKPGATVIDVGITRDPRTGKLTGDVDRASVDPIAGAITPVPGGVGPMTIAMLLVNTLRAFRQHAPDPSRQPAPTA